MRLSFNFVQAGEYLKTQIARFDPFPFQVMNEICELVMGRRSLPVPAGARSGGGGGIEDTGLS